MSSNQERRVLTRVKVSDLGDEIVISGISGRFPQSANVAEFGYNLYNKIDMVVEEETRWKHVHENMPKRLGIVGNLEKFDTNFFSIPFKQANFIDPQARILLEHSYEAIVDAGICPKSFRGSRTGVFVGCSSAEVDEYFYFDIDIKDGLGLTGCARALLANRISFAMDFKGPSFTLDTACSSSAYALNQAFNAIRTGECDSAIVAGTNLLLHPATTAQFYRLGVLSKDGFCRPFDKDASGYSRSEAINVLLLQKVKDAKRVYAKFMYSKTNVDGFKNEGLNYPSGQTQMMLMEEFYREIGIDASTIDYVEAHSTGTKVGDPEECTTLDAIFCRNRKTPLPVGSVKSNMGHSEAPSMICSIVKSLLVFENGKIPPNLHFRQPRPDIPALVEGRLQVVTEVQDFQGSIIAVNSFGFGGANAHALLAINPKVKINFGIPNDELPRLILWSGRTEEAVNYIFDSVTKQPLDGEYVALLQNVQTATQSANTYRGFGVFKQERDLSKPPTNAICLTRHVANFSSSKRPIVFIFSGMGSQWSSMGADLLKIPIVSTAINNCHKILATKGLNLLQILTSDDPKMFDNILHSFVGIAAIQIGLTDLIKAVGIVPDFIIGHSVGELGCAYADGCLTAEEMILAAYSRGMASLETKVIQGSMAAVGIGFEQLKTMLDEGVEIACHNNAESCTISGPAKIVADFVKKLKAKNIFAKEVACSNIPYHSTYIAEMGSKLLERLKGVIKEPKTRSTKWISSSVPKPKWDLKESKISSAEYHTNNLLSPVLFEESCVYLPKDAVTIEIAPHGLLQAIVKRTFPEGQHFSVTKRGCKENFLFLLESLGKIFESGIDLDASKIYPAIEFPVSRSTPMISPSIRWDHTENFFVPKYNDKVQSELKFNVTLTIADYEFISGHEIDGRILFPATGYLFLIWKLAILQNKIKFDEMDLEFEDVKYLRACYLTKNQTTELTAVIHRGTGRFEISERKNPLVTGVVRNLENAKLTPVFDFGSSSEDDLTTKDFYKELRLRGYHYKNLFQSVVSARMDGTGGSIKWQDNWTAFMDCLLQLQILTKDTRSLALPTAIRSVIIKPREHFAAVEKSHDKIMKVFYSKELKMLRCGGVEIRGLRAQLVSRRNPPGEPVLENHQFVPHFPTPILSKSDVARFCVQLVLENLQTLKVVSIEINTNDKKSPISEFFAQALNDLPLVTHELTYLTSKDENFELEGVKVSNEEFTEFKNLTIVIRSNCIEDSLFMKSIALNNENVFVIARESKHGKEKILETTEGFKIVAVCPCDDETIVVFWYNKTPPPSPTNIIKITNSNIDSWLPKLKELIKINPTLIYSQNESKSGILGLVNCIRKEPNGSNLTAFFIDDPHAPSFDITNPFYSYQLHKGLAVNVYRNSEWGTYKHLLLTPTYTPRPQTTSCYANSLLRGDLSSIKWLQGPLTGDSLIKVQYSSLNFRDVMLATGKLVIESVDNERLDQLCVLGFEFAGTTCDGRRVMGLRNSGALASHIEKNLDAILYWDCPDNWTLAECATIPCIYGTVYAAFFMTSRISSGKSILIHAGTGGVGLAAIRVAFGHGMDVFTTVSTEEKKNYLLSEFPQLKADNIGNSRDTSFEDMVMMRTGGKGVDFVLNSLAEEKLHASIRCLAQGGTFLEIGKYDIKNDNKIGLGEFGRELNFHAVHVDNMFEAQVEKQMMLKQLVQDGIKTGIIKPIKSHIFKADDIESAFRLLASGKHMGKVIIQLRENEFDEATIPMSVLPRVYCSSEMSYIIPGGLGGFGLELADWLILRGCRKLVLSSSQGMSKKYQLFRIGIWKSYGVKVIINTSDISTFDGCNNLISDAIKLGPVGGIFNLAVRLSDGLFENQTTDSFNTSMAPKAIATEFLDQITRKRCPSLQYFVVFSSVSCGRGNAGQSNYGMSNSVMERIIEGRHKAGLPAKAIQWGAVGEVGLVADMQENKIDMEIGGTLQQRITSCLDELDTLLTVEDPIVSSMVVAEKRYSSGSKGGIIEMIMNIMTIKDIKTLSLESKLSELGMDSLMTVEISQSLEREFNLVVTPQELRSMTLAQLKAIEASGGVVSTDSGKLHGLDFLLRNLGDESRSCEKILKLESENSSNIKALIVPGIEGVGGKIYSDLAKNLKYSTYLVQFANSWNTKTFDEMYNSVIEEVIELFASETSFILIGYSYGALMALKFTKTLERLGLNGKLILIDGSPDFLKLLLNDQLPEGVSDETIQTLVIQRSLKIVIPNDSSDRLSKVLAEKNWDDRIAKIDVLYNDFTMYSKEYLLRSLTAILNRLRMLISLNLKVFDVLKTPIKLLKPLEAAVDAIDGDYGLVKFTLDEVEIKMLEGNHMTILENKELPNVINNSFF